MKLFERLKNLWKLSEYTIKSAGMLANPSVNDSANVLAKNIETRVNKLATIIPEEKEDNFKIQDA